MVRFLYTQKHAFYKYCLIYFCKSQTRIYLIANQRSFVLEILLSILTGMYFSRFFIMVVRCFHSNRAISVAENHLIIPSFIYIVWNKISNLCFIIVFVFCISFIFVKSCIVFNDFFHFDFHWAIFFDVDLVFSFRIKIFLQCHNHLLLIKWNKYTFFELKSNRNDISND